MTAHVNALQQVLADSYTLYLKTQNYHWNVKGMQFHPLHVLFGEQYTELAAAIDEIAERIRALGEDAPGSFKAFSELKTLEEAKQGIDAPAMIKDLAADQETIVKRLEEAAAAAEKAKDAPTVDMLVTRMAAHQKNGWMLSAMLQK
jgi:starvation-inducible DNA-binding protein